MLKIESVEKYSIAEELKIKAGDTLVQINGQDINDILDYIFFDSLEDVDIAIKKPSGKLVIHEISKDEPLGLSFESDEIEAEACCNRCIFCFVDQLPKGMRKTLNFKDDDYRLSFISGNYVTLTNIGEKEIDRIIRQKISPLYISVHAADTALRRKILGNSNAQDIIKLISRLASAGIEMHCQVVLCGGINDGEVLADTTRQLFKYYPSVKSLAVVPIGLTKHREGLMPLKVLTKKQAAAAIDFVEGFNNDNGVLFVYCSDEMYMLAKRRLPMADYYGDYCQIENGVGLIRKFEEEFLEALDAAEGIRVREQSISILTGVSAEGFLQKLAAKFVKRFPQIKIEIIAVKNDFFGHTVTVAGLVTGSDILKTLSGRLLSDRIIIPKVMLKEFSTVFLDNIKLSEVESHLGKKIEVCAVDGAALVEKLIKN